MPPFDPLVFRTTDLSRWGSGGPLLTEGQADNNFWNLDYRITFIENNPPTAVSISSFTVSGSQFYVNMSDSSVLGPYTLPAISINPRGQWQPLTNYATNDIFDYNGTVYIVTWPHTSAATFDAGANDGFGHFYYKIFVQIPGSSLPLGGTQDQVLGKVDATDLNVAWVNGIPPGGSFGDVLTRLNSPVIKNGTSYDYDWVSLSGTTFALSELSDVYLSSQQVGDLLQWNGSQWLNTTILDLNINFSDLSGIASPVQVRQQTLTILATTSPSPVDANQGDIHIISPNADVSIFPSNFPPGARITIIVQVIDSTNHTLTFGSGMVSSGTLQTGTTNFGKFFTITFFTDGSLFYETGRSGPLL